ncbi:MAG: hypothetical protein Q4F28_02360 [Eubacteriales bacterium]|nr:hypothetical protein [Eubacteriales bacterium]
MKKYSICLYVFLAASLICLTIGYLARVNSLRAEGAGRDGRGPEHVEEYRDEESGLTAGEPQTMAEDQMAANGEQVEHRMVQEEYYLVAEDGFLLVFLKDKETICLYTHVPIMDFPAAEQDRLREGIWFPSMMEVFQYLESYTS